jgi:hypothetical protein
MRLLLMASDASTSNADFLTSDADLASDASTSDAHLLS